MSLFLLKEGHSLQLVIYISSFTHPRDFASLCKCCKQLRNVLSENEFIWSVYAKRLPLLKNDSNRESLLEDIKTSMHFPSYKSLCITFLDFFADFRFSIFHGCDSVFGTLWFMQLKSGIGLEFTEIQGKRLEQPQEIRLEIGRSFNITYNEIKNDLSAKKIKSKAGHNHLNRQELIRFSCGSFKFVETSGKCMLHLHRLIEPHPNDTDRMDSINFIPPVQIINSVTIPQSLHLKPLSEPQVSSFPTLNQAGIFASEYGDHGIEFFQLSCHSMTESSEKLLDISQFGSLQLQGFKLTGDPNVHAGKLSFYIDLNRQVNKAEIFAEDSGFIHNLALDHDINNITFCASGFGQLNKDQNVWDPHWTGCTFVLYTSLRQHLQRFSIIWDHIDESDGWVYRNATIYCHISDFLPSDFTMNHI